VDSAVRDVKEIGGISERLPTCGSGCSVQDSDGGVAENETSMACGYPADWEEIAARIKAAAGWRCEHCGWSHDPTVGRVLTVHHIDGNPANCNDENLAALCQVCHLRWQGRWLPEWGKGQTLLFPTEKPAWLAKRGL